MDDIIRRLTRLERALGAIAAQDHSPIKYASSNTSAPPTNAELDTLFGTAGTTPVMNGFVGVVFDSGVSGVAYLVGVANGTWYTWTGTLAA